MDRSPILRPLGATLLVGGIVMLLSGIWASLIGFKLGAVLAIPSFLVFILVAASEMSTGKSVWMAIMGSWRGIMTTLLMVILVRVLMIYLGWGGAIVTRGAGTELVFSYTLENILFWCNVVLLAVEAVIILVLYRRSDLFMSQDDGGASRCTAIAGSKTVSECPSCNEVVESFWQSCPYCGTSLPRVCGGCGLTLDELATVCPQCGKDAVDSESMEKTIATFKALVQEDVLPEAKATRYARLAEALLKNGDTEGAVAAYQQAIRHTAFPRKRTNFMVRAARILKNTGNRTEAFALLDEAMRLDPSDVAGAGPMQAEMKA